MLAAPLWIRKYSEFWAIFGCILENIVSFGPGMNEAQLYEGLFSWLAFYTCSNFVWGEIRRNMVEIWGPRANARLEGTTRPTMHRLPKGSKMVFRGGRRQKTVLIYENIFFRSHLSHYNRIQLDKVWVPFELKRN